MINDAYKLTAPRSIKVRRSELYAVIALLALGFILRLGLPGSLPLGLNQDEASAGYDAWAILNYGVDRCGSSLPVLLTSWGSGQNALLSYLSMPFIAIFGLSETTLRIVPALFGCLTLIFFWALARRARGAGFGLCALFVLAICPWHIMISRWALESNLLPALLLAGVCFVCRAGDRDAPSPWSLLPGAVLFALSLYAYGTAYFLLPFLLIFCCLWLGKQIRPLPFIVSLGVFFLIALPISLCQLRNVLGLPSASFLGLTLPELTESRQTSTSVLGGGGVSSAIKNFASFLQLLITQSDGLKFNSLGLNNGGIFYVTGLPLCVAGIIREVWSLKYSKDAPVLIWLCCCLPAAFLVDVNINRMNMVWLPLVYFSALGLHHALCKFPYFGTALAAVMTALCIIFSASYCGAFGGDGNVNYFPGLGECIEYVDQQQPDSAYISTYVNQPYIFALLYTETPPEEFLDSVNYVNSNGAFRQVSSFGYWSFGTAKRASGQYLILHVSESDGGNILFSAGQFVVSAG